MAVNLPLEQESATDSKPIVNDFAFSVATQNGSGSQTSNAVLVRSLFNMGIPVNGKNLFPSNIKGLPTWYTIRASKDGYVARRFTTEIVVAYNQDTVTEDIKNTPPGGVVIYRDDLKTPPERDDITYYPVPVRKLMKEANVARAFKARVENMTYVGVCAQLFDMDMDVVYQSLLDQFGGKEKPAQMNMDVIRLAYDWAAENLIKSDPFRFETMNGTAGKILITGNEAAALGSVFGGVHFVAWYPITPSTSVVDDIHKYRHLRKDDDGNYTLAIVQAEDELAAAGMIIGAGFGGARSMTATSGPGLSLMSEFVGLAYFAEIPCVFWDITRMGPSTGMPTRTSQGDLLFIHYLGHGDSHHIVLLPASPEEAFEFAWRSLDIAEEMQTPVFVMSDLDLGMNNWMADPFEYPSEPLKRGKVLDAESLTKFIKNHGKWGRYMDVDNDGVGYRTLPGTDHPNAAYFARGTGHNEMAVYSERSEDWLANMNRLRLKMETAKQHLPQNIEDYDANKSIGLISFGTNEPAMVEARDWLKNNGIESNYLRVRALPLSKDVFDFINKHKTIYVIENNFDGQLDQIIHMECKDNLTHVKSLTLGDGLPMTARWIVESIEEQETK
ncbi:MAG: 2-oxoacid:acceptor oxidoreductase subunit alpha [Anaerolineae bacterium]|nr:2-oxoacid:acceptor oxidoreductase subunit alpha [Anaerolineae bacterium]MDQ7034821.1 2-oxoacid:acceptor oxidoreductase subunit alpha [Anaerolineae bacterium]